jgi:hypothetical protein
MGTTQRNRRRFLKNGAALAGLTVTDVRRRIDCRRMISSTPTQLTVTEPALQPGTYSLVVSCGTLAGRTVTLCQNSSR